MSNTCKFCQAEIVWLKQDGKSVPANPDGSRHQCKTQSTVSSQSNDRLLAIEQAHKENIEAMNALTKAILALAGAIQASNFKPASGA